MRFEEQGDTICCFFSGDQNSEICAAIEPELSSRIEVFLTDRDRASVVFDLAEVEYVSSAFLRICLWCCKLVGNRNFSIRRVSPELFKIFRIAGFVEMMNITD